MHAATLLHDDVLDDGRTRRGMPAARVLWGNAASVLGGDFLLMRALELTAATGVVGALGDLLAAIGRMIDGEALQLQHRGRSDLDAAGYIDVVDGKTASLFAWCGRAGRAAGRRATPRSPTRSAPTACTSGAPSRSSTTCSTSRAIRARSARSVLSMYAKAS